MMTIEVGQQAPDFTLPNQDRQPTTLSESRGHPVILIFYPFDFSGVCTAEHCEVRDDYGAWLEQGAEIFGISRDSIFAHQAFKAANELPYDLLADMKGEVATLYSTWNADVSAAERLTVVIDAEGKVVYTTKSGAIPEARNHSDVLQHIG
jgi:peroxiredoxin